MISSKIFNKQIDFEGRHKIGYDFTGVKRTFVGRLKTNYGNS